MIALSSLGIGAMLPSGYLVIKVRSKRLAQAVLEYLKGPLPHDTVHENLAIFRHVESVHGPAHSAPRIRHEGPQKCIDSVILPTTVWWQPRDTSLCCDCALLRHQDALGSDSMQ